MRPILFGLALLALAAPKVAGQSCLVPNNQLVSGGPGKDGIPALTRPRTMGAVEGATAWAPDTLVLGVVIGGEARAYPHNILWWHEIVNDVVGGQPIALSYCPLTGSGMVYEPLVRDRVSDFGVSGLLFDNNLVLYDRNQPETLWSQMRVQGICGAEAGRKPRLLPVTQSTWAAWRALHPETTILHPDTGHRRSYSVYPYGTYDRLDDSSLLFPQSFVDPRRPMKELVFGFTQEGVSRAWPYGALGERAAINDHVGARAVLVVWDQQAQMAIGFDRTVGEQTFEFELEEAGGFPFRLRDRQTGSLWSLDGLAVEGPLAVTPLPRLATFSAMWFAWASFHRGTELYLP